MEDVRSWHTLMRSEKPYELRVVGLLEGDDGAFTVEERSDGEQTLLAFDALSCVRRMGVQGQHAEEALRALGACGETIPTVLGRIFSTEDAFLSDVMDVMDAAGVPYTYSLTCGNELQLRPQTVPEKSAASTVSTK